MQPFAVRVVAPVTFVLVAGCARVENAHHDAPPVASPSASPDPSPAPPAATGGGVGAECFTSLVRMADGGGPSVEARCGEGLVCDYENAVPDGPGRCKRR